jgi:hypothetical protein
LLGEEARHLGRKDNGELVVMPGSAVTVQWIQVSD